MVFLSDSGFFTNCLSCPCWMRSSIASLIWMQSSIVWPWHLWNRQYFVLSTPFLSCDGAFGGSTPASARSATAISTKIFSLDMAKGVYFVKRPLGALPSQTSLPSFFFSWKGFLEDSAEGEKKHKKGGRWIVLRFYSFSPKLERHWSEAVQEQLLKWCSELGCSG